MMKTQIRKKLTSQKYLAGWVSILILLFLLLVPSIQAFMPNCDQLLHMMEKAMGQTSSGFFIQQTKIIPELDGSSANQNSSQYSFMEKLTISCPGNLRADILSESNSGYSVESNLQYIKVLNDIIISKSKSIEDHYTDILLCQSEGNLKAMLTLLGMDTARVGYDRCRGKICYAAGNPDPKNPSTTLWIDHETFLPVRYRLCLNNQTIDFFYENWEKTSKIWYPMHITMYMDDKVITTIEVKHVKRIKETNQPDSSLFDIQNRTNPPRKHKLRFAGDGHPATQKDRPHQRAG